MKKIFNFICSFVYNFIFDKALRPRRKTILLCVPKNKSPLLSSTNSVKKGGN
jgi:hypothetical protein